VRIATTSILDTIDHPLLFAPWFRKPATWSAWRVFLAVLFSLPIADNDLDLFRCCTGLHVPLPGGFIEASPICARRAGKWFIRALVAVYLAIFRGLVRVPLPASVARSR
jgi:hypothetical protein